MSPPFNDRNKRQWNAWAKRELNASPSGPSFPAGRIYLNGELIGERAFRSDALRAERQELIDACKRELPPDSVLRIEIDGYRTIEGKLSEL